MHQSFELKFGRIVEISQKVFLKNLFKLFLEKFFPLKENKMPSKKSCCHKAKSCGENPWKKCKPCQNGITAPTSVDPNIITVNNNCIPSNNLGPFTQTFNVSSAFVVPACVNSLDIVAIGAPGGNTGSGTTLALGGVGAIVTGTVPVTPGQLLTVTVGTAGTNSPGGSATPVAGGVPNGGTGGTGGGTSTAGGGGGGFSGVFNGTTQLVIAGAGGGAGGAGAALGGGVLPGGIGGSGGSPATAGTSGTGGSTGGGAGNQANGGTAGMATPNATSGTAGSSLTGGNGGNGGLTAAIGAGGGGGGSGFFGGGGGGGAFLGSAAGGGAGSSFAPFGGSTATATTRTPSVTITYSFNPLLCGPCPTPNPCPPCEKKEPCKDYRIFKFSRC